MKYPLFSDQDYADFFKVTREINKGLHHINEKDQIGAIKKGLGKAKEAMKDMAEKYDGLMNAITNGEERIYLVEKDKVAKTEDMSETNEEDKKEEKGIFIKYIKVEEEEGKNIIIEVLKQLRRSVSIGKKFKTFRANLKRILPRTIFIKELASEISEVNTLIELFPELLHKDNERLSSLGIKASQIAKAVFWKFNHEKETKLSEIKKFIDEAINASSSSEINEQLVQLRHKAINVILSNEKENDQIDKENRVWISFEMIIKSRNEAVEQLFIVFQKIIELQEASGEYVNYFKDRIPELNRLFNTKFTSIDESNSNIKILLKELPGLLAEIRIDTLIEPTSEDTKDESAKRKKDFIDKYNELIDHVANIRENISDLLIERNKFRGLSLYYAPNKGELLKRKYAPIRIGKSILQRNDVSPEKIADEIQKIWVDIGKRNYLDDLKTKKLKDDIIDSFSRFWLVDANDQEDYIDESSDRAKMEEDVLRRALSLIGRLCTEENRSSLKEYFEFFLKSGKVTSWRNFIEQIKIIFPDDDDALVLNMDKRKIFDTNWQLNVYLEKLGFEKFLQELSKAPELIIEDNYKIFDIINNEKRVNNKSGNGIDNDHVQKTLEGIFKVGNLGHKTKVHEEKKVQLINQLAQAIESLQKRNEKYFIREVDFFLGCTKKHFKDVSSKAFSEKPTEYRPNKIKNQVLKDSLQKQGLKNSRKFRKVFECIDNRIFANDRLKEFFWYFKEEQNQKKSSDKIYEKLADDIVFWIVDVLAEYKKSHQGFKQKYGNELHLIEDNVERELAQKTYLIFIKELILGLHKTVNDTQEELQKNQNILEESQKIYNNIIKLIQIIIIELQQEYFRSISNRFDERFPDKQSMLKVIERNHREESKELIEIIIADLEWAVTEDDRKLFNLVAINRNKENIRKRLFGIVKFIRDQFRNSNKDYQGMVDEVVSRLEEVKVRRYNILNEILNSSNFIKVSDKFQIYGGAFGIWNQEAKQLVRIQDRRYTPESYRPDSYYNDPWYDHQALSNKWFDLPERTIMNGEWVTHPYKESVDLLFLSEEIEMIRPDFYQNFSKEENNTLLDIEKDNQFLFCEDGEISAFILLYRFLDGSFNTKINDYYFFESIDEDDLDLREQKLKERSEKVKNAWVLLKNILNPDDTQKELIDNFLQKGMSIFRFPIKVKKDKLTNELPIELNIDGQGNKTDVKILNSIVDWNKLNATQKSFVEFNIALKNIELYYKALKRFFNYQEVDKEHTFKENGNVQEDLDVGAKESSVGKNNDNSNFIFISKDKNVYLSDYLIRVMHMFFTYDGFIEQGVDKHVKKSDEVEYAYVNSSSFDPYSPSEENIKDLVEKALWSFTKENVSRNCWHFLLRSIFNPESFLKLQFARQFISDSSDANAYDKSEARVRQEKIKRTFDRRLDLKPVSFARELHTQGLIGNESDLAEYGKSFDIYDGDYRTLVLEEYPNQYTVTERYVNLCKFIERELNPVKKRLKIKSKFNKYVDKINPENYFIDRRIGKLEIEENEADKQVREAYISKIRQDIIAVVKEESKNLKVPKKDVTEQIVSIVSLLLEAVHPFLGGKQLGESSYNFIQKLNGLTDEEGRPALWGEVKKHINRIARFPISQHFAWRSNRLYAHSSLIFPIASTTTNKEASKVGFLILGIRNIIEKESGKVIHITHDTEAELKELIYTIRSIYQPLVHPLMDHIYYNQIVNKSVQDNAIRAAVARVMARNLSHNIGSHVLGKLSDPGKYAGRIKKLQGNARLDKNKDKLVTNLNKYLRERMDLIADISTTTPVYVSTNSLSSIVDDFYSVTEFSQKLLLHYISGVLNRTSKHIHIFVNHTNKLYVSTPHDLLGVQAFYVILENIIRNAFKHNDINKINKINKSVFKCLYLKIGSDQNENNWKKKFIKLDIEILFMGSDDQPMKVPLNSKGKDLDKKLEEIFDLPILDPNTKQLRLNYWGLLEMKIATAYLRRVPLPDIDKGIEDGPPLIKVNSRNNLKYSIFLERPLEILFVYDSKHEKSKIQEINKAREILELKGIDIISSDSTDYDALIEQFMPDGIPETDYNFLISDFIDFEDSPVQRTLKEEDFLSFIINNNDLDFIMAKVWMAWIEKNRNEPNKYDSNYFSSEIYLHDGSKKYKIINELTIETLKDFSKIRSYPLAKLNSLESTIHIEDHDNNFPEIHDKLYENDYVNHDWVFYLSFKNINYVLREQIRSIKINKDKNVSLQILGKLLEGAQTGIAILDERVQFMALEDSIYKTKSEDHPQSIPRLHVLEMAGIYIPRIKGLGKLNLQGDESYDIDEIYKWIKHNKNRKINFLIIHVGVVEKAFDSTNEADLKKIMKEVMNNYRIQLVFVSGRGKPANLPDMAYFLNSSILMNYLFSPLNKIKLTQVLYSLRRIPRK